MAKKKKFVSEEVAGFCNQVAIILRSGIGLEEGMYMLAEEMEDAVTKQIMKSVEQQLKEGKSFQESLQSTEAFPAYMVNMVRVGEASGKLEDVMRSLSKFYEREHIIKTSIRNVVSYPLLMFLMIAIILTALVSWILPMFQNVFTNLNVDAASSSSKIMHFGMTVGTTVSVLAAVIILAALCILLWYQTDNGKKSLINFANGFILTRKIGKLMATGKFVSSLSVMLSSGIEPAEAMEMAQEVVEHKELQGKIQHCLEEMDQEKSFADILREEEILTGMQGRMVAIASKAGVMDEVLYEISDQYDEKIADHLGQFCSRIETSLVFGLSIIVGGVLIAVMFPLISIITSIG